MPFAVKSVPRSFDSPSASLRVAQDDMALFERSRVASYVTASREIPPILLLHGDQDGDVTAENSRKLYRKLMAEGKTAVFYELPGRGHGGAMLWEKAFLDLAEEFIRHFLA